MEGCGIAGRRFGRSVRPTQASLGCMTWCAHHIARRSLQLLDNVVDHDIQRVPWPHTTLASPCSARYVSSTSMALHDTVRLPGARGMTQTCCGLQDLDRSRECQVAWGRAGRSARTTTGRGRTSRRIQGAHELRSHICVSRLDCCGRPALCTPLGTRDAGRLPTRYGASASFSCTMHM